MRASEDHGSGGSVERLTAELKRTNEELRRTRAERDQLRRRLSRREGEAPLADKLLDELPGALVYFDLRLVIRRVNRTYAELFGKTADEFVGRHALDVYRGIESPVPRILAQVVAHRQPHTMFGAPFIFSDDRGPHETYWDFTVQDVSDDGGERCGVLLLCFDVTPRVHLEQELARKTLALEESREQYRRLVEVSPDAIIVHDGERVLYVNPAATKILRGVRPEDVTDKPVFSLVAPRSTEQVRGRIEQLQHGETQPLVEEVLYRLDGTELDAEVAGAPILYNNRPAFQVVFRDVTERKRSEARLRELNEQLARMTGELEHRVAERTAELEAANKDLEAFSYSVSHDLRAPLRSVDGFSQLLLEGYGDRLDAVGRDYLQRMRAASQHMAQLIDDLLRLSRVTREPLRREEVDLSALARTVASGLQATQPERAVDWVVADGVRATGDARLLRVLLENLLGNAWKFTGKHPRARIEFGVREEQDRRVYFVRDDGAGFDMAYADRLFAPFSRLHAMSDFPGTGIGLTTVQRILRRHGGRICADSAVGKGATFFFTL